MFLEARLRENGTHIYRGEKLSEMKDPLGRERQEPLGWRRASSFSGFLHVGSWPDLYSIPSTCEVKPQGEGEETEIKANVCLLSNLWHPLITCYFS